MGLTILWTRGKHYGATNFSWAPEPIATVETILNRPYFESWCPLILVVCCQFLAIDSSHTLIALSFLVGQNLVSIGENFFIKSWISKKLSINFLKSLDFSYFVAVLNFMGQQQNVAPFNGILLSSTSYTISIMLFL